MGGAQPLAVTMNGGVAICVEVDPSRIQRRLETALPRRRGRQHRPRARARHRRATGPLSIGLLGNCADVFPELLRRDAPIDIVTDQTSAHDPLAYLPSGIAFEDWADARTQPGLHRPRPRVDGPPRRGDGRLPGRGRRGLRLRQLASAPRPSSAATSARSTSPASSPPTSARCSARARARSAGPRCPATRPTSPPPTRPCSTSSPRTSRCTRWIKLAAGEGPVPGPAGAHLLARRGRAPPRRPGVQRPRRERRPSPRPIVIGRDHLDCGSRRQPVPRDRGDARRLRRDRRLAAAERDGQRRQRRLLGRRSTTAAASASAAAIHAGQVSVADGTPLAAQKLERVLTNDPAHGRDPPRRRRLRARRGGRGGEAASACRWRSESTTYFADFAWLGGDARRRDVRSTSRTGGSWPSARRQRAGTHLRGVTIPGLANAHSHAFQRALRGRTQRGGGSFWTWREDMYALASTMTPDGTYELARGHLRGDAPRGDHDASASSTTCTTARR